MTAALPRRAAPNTFLLTLSLVFLFSGCEAHPVNSGRVDRGERLAEALSDEELAIAPIDSNLISGVIPLEDLLDLARRNNASLQRAGYAALVAKAQRDEAIASVLFPTLNGRLNYFSRSNQPATLANFGGARTRIPTGQKSMTNFDANLRQPLFSVSDFYFRAGAVDLQSKAARLQVRQVQNQVRQAVIRAALDVLDLRFQVEGLDALLRSLREQERIIRAMLAEGMAISNDVYQVEVEIARQEQARTELTNAARTAQVLLCTLVGLDPDSNFQIVWDLELPEQPGAPSANEAFDLALRNRPDLLALEVNRAATRKFKLTEWTQYVPRLDLGVGYSYSDADVLLEDDFFFYNLTGSIDLLDFSRHARIKRFEAESGQLAGQSLELERQIRVDLEQAVNSVANELSRFKQAGVAERASIENVRVRQALYQAGKATINDTLEAEVTLTQARIGRRSARYGYYRALADLDAICGASGAFFPLR